MAGIWPAGHRCAFLAIIGSTSPTHQLPERVCLLSAYPTIFVIWEPKVMFFKYNK